MSINNGCKLCAKGVDTEPGLSQGQIAKKYNVARSSVQRHLKHITKNDQPQPLLGVVRPAVEVSEPDVDDFLLSQGIPQEIVTSRGKSVRLEDGSWEKVSWQPNAKAIHDSLQYDDLSPLLENWEPRDYVREGGEYTDVLNASDLQIGKANQRGGGTVQTVERVKTSFSRFASRLESDNPHEAALVDGGDPIENVFNVKEQMVTNDLDVPAQIRTFRRLMLEGIKLFSPLVPVLYYVAVPSNHGAFRTDYKAQGGSIDADFGLEISYQLEDIVNENPFLRDRVQFIRPEPLYETAILETSSTRVAFHHGHQSSYSAHKEWWAKQDHGRMPGWDADLLVTAHYHTMGLDQSGDGRWIIKTASSDVGSDWFTNKTGERAMPGMTAFKVRDGMWSDLALL